MLALLRRKTSVHHFAYHCWQAPFWELHEWEVEEAPRLDHLKLRLRGYGC